MNKKDGIRLDKVLAKRLNDLGFENTVINEVLKTIELNTLDNSSIDLLLEQALQNIAFDFEKLPTLCEGESKIIKKWTDKVLLMSFKPTVYSYTQNRYGLAEGTEKTRIKFSSALFRKMAAENFTQDFKPQSAFLAEINNEQGCFMVQQMVETCNLEVRIKRYHIGSPLHRYYRTEDYSSLNSTGPIMKWSRFDKPVVCFDWRNPLMDADGKRLADEPISDDYAELWMENPSQAKEVARNTFIWMEELFAKAEILLVDMCLFIDKSGNCIYGEISPDCMRARSGLEDPATTEPLAKDNWRLGESSATLLDKYEEMYERIFKGVKV